MILQSERLPIYRAALERLRRAGAVFPCRCTRSDVLAAAVAPHEGAETDEPIYPGTCRKWRRESEEIEGVNWRFRVSDGEEISFRDGRLGEQRAVAGRDFGDFVVWRKDGVPSYQLACAVDDAEMGITEVVRGADLVKSTFRQLLILRALGARPPAYFHCPLLTDADGRRLAKREDSLSLRALRERGTKAEEVVARYCHLPAAGP
jgi:glutamyl/glutaminyl-tRNA synthetase